MRTAPPCCRGVASTSASFADLHHETGARDGAGNTRGWAGVTLFFGRPPLLQKVVFGLESTELIAASLNLLPGKIEQIAADPQWVLKASLVSLRA